MMMTMIVMMIMVMMTMAKVGIVDSWLGSVLNFWPTGSNSVDARWNISGDHEDEDQEGKYHKIFAKSEWVKKVLTLPGPLYATIDLQVFSAKKSRSSRPQGAPFNKWTIFNNKQTKNPLHSDHPASSVQSLS